MHLALAALAEQLAHDFRELQCSAVVRVLTDCADEYPHGGVHFIEQAARARLARLGAAQSLIPEQRAPGPLPA
jgi:hypothetical protein